MAGLDNLNVLGSSQAGTTATIEEQTELLLRQFDTVNTFFIAKIAEQIRRIGMMSQASINTYTVMSQMVQDIGEINAQLQKALGASRSILQGIFQTALDNVYTDQRFRRALTETPLPDAAKARLEQYVQAVSRQTAGTLQNLSNTTAVSQQYRDAVDKAILAVSSGMGDYKAATRQVVRELGYGGMKILYASGYRRRLDSSVRQNIVDATRQINQHGSDIMGEALGFDAYEISAHANSAPDHEPIQGHVLLADEFHKMQSGQPFTDVDGRRYAGFRRSIGEWNCMHIALSFSTKYSVRKFTDAQLRQFIDDNHRGCTIGKRHYTIYQARQLMRQIETEVRREKDAGNAARLADDEQLRTKCQQRIDVLVTQYEQVSAASGLRQRKDRMQVDGYKMVRIKS